QNTIGGSSEDYLQSLQQTTDGGYILAGYSNSSISGDKTTAPKGASDYWVVKLSTTGTIEWQNTIGGSGYEQLEAIQQTTDGGYILGGASSSGISGDKTEASKGSSDYWVVKISNVGDVSWERTIGGNGSDYLQDIQQTIDGGYILGGSSTSGISGDKTEASYPDFFGLGAGDFWIVKLSDINTNPPLAQFTAPIATFLYAPTTFTNTTTDYINTPNAGTTPSSYQWLIDNVPIATSTHLTYTFTEPGIHDITLVADNGDCVDTYNQLITVLDKGVWPGDANNDGTVSMLDYLAWGIAVDYVDIPRLDQSIDWSPKFAGDYNQNFGGDLWSNTNYKHADCNGNGVINGSDTTAIVQNFGLSYLPTPPLVNNTTPQATLTLENNTPLIAANALASFSLQLQNTLNGGVVNAYGLAFTLHYNGIENPSLDFSESCWGIIGTDFHVLLIPDANNHQIHVGITRTDHNNRLLLGEVLELQGIVTAALGSNVTVSLSDIVLLNAEAYQIPAVGTDAAMQVSNSTPPILLEVKTLLQCSVTDVSISNSLMTNNYSNTLPTQQPFNTAPWNYNGSENGTIPANAVDWMLLELRNATNQVVGRKAVLLLSNGYLQEVGTPLQANRIALYGVDVLQNYYVVLRNRTHQTIASSNTLSINNNLLSVDFTQDPAQTTGGIANLVEMNGWYAMKRTAITPVISGNTNVCGGQPKNYSNTNALAGLTYAWEVSGGTIVSGQGTNTVSVQWTNATATGTLTLTATDRLCNETATASITVNLTPDAVIIVGGNASGGGVAGVTSHNL
ncbi:MAG TPA: hypothetical protein PKH93_05085, partial [Chitinophagales bacterium]|nr:hypothetical protein [Chitinophagales bacterium]